MHAFWVAVQIDRCLFGKFNKMYEVFNAVGGSSGRRTTEEVLFLPFNKILMFTSYGTEAGAFNSVIVMY